MNSIRTNCSTQGQTKIPQSNRNLLIIQILRVFLLLPKNLALLVPRDKSLKIEKNYPTSRSIQRLPLTPPTKTQVPKPSS